MRTLLVVLSIALVLTFIQYSNGIPVQSVSSSSEEDDSVESEMTSDNKLIDNKSDESDEPTISAKAVPSPVDQSEQNDNAVDGLRAIQKSPEPDSNSVEDIDDDSVDDDLTEFFPYITNAHRAVVSEESDEN